MSVQFSSIMNKVNSSSLSSTLIKKFINAYNEMKVHSLLSTFCQTDEVHPSLSNVLINNRH